MISRILNKFKPARGRGDTTADSWLVIAPGVEAAANDAGLTVLDTIGGRVFVGSEAAAVMWLSASKGLSIGETADVIAIRFGVERDVAERRIRLFVELMQNNGLAMRRATQS